jgi:hypothetical protein
MNRTDMSCCWGNTVYCTAEFGEMSVFGAESDGKGEV